MKKIISLVLAAVLFITTIIAPLPVYAAETGSDIYVSASGNDSNAGTESEPVATVAKALELVENGGTIHIVGTVSASSWAAPTKDVTFTGGTLDFGTMTFGTEKHIVLGTAGKDLTFKNINLKVGITIPTEEEDSDKKQRSKIRMYANGCNLTMADGVKILHSADEEIVPAYSISLYAGSKGGTITGDTNITVLSGNYCEILGGGKGGTINGNTNVYVGGTTNNLTDVTSHSKWAAIYGGGAGDTITGRTNVIFTESAQANYVYGGSNGTGSSIGNGSYVTFTGNAKSMALYGASAGAQQNSNANVLMLGGEIQQLFGGCESASMGDADTNVEVNVDVKVLGGKVTRRIYGGCYNNYVSFKWQSSHYVYGQITLTIGSGANITLDCDDNDLSIFARSRQKTISSTEVTTINYVDGTTTSVSKNGTQGVTDLAGGVMIGGISATDTTHTHTLTYAPSSDGAAIVESCTCGHSATAALSVIDRESRVYNGTAYEDAELTIDYWNWLGSRDLTITYENNVNAGTATASVTYSGATASVTFDIEKAEQKAPASLKANAETYKSQANGTITGLTTEMQYSTNGTDYTDITDTAMTFAAGTYYVRYAEKDNYKASPATEVVIATGATLKVTVPTDQVGYTLTTSATELDWHGNATITFELADGYSTTDTFAVKVNDSTVELDEKGQYAIENAETNFKVTVEGVADTTAPTAEITLGKNKWNSFLNGLSFNLFFKETQSVTITAEDVNTGSGLDKIYYYLSEKELTLDEVKAITDWNEYRKAFNINPDKEYIIYAKATDKAGNTVYVNSEGIVLDATTPAITEVEDGKTYYGDTTFKAEDTYLDNVTVDGKEVSLTDGTYTIKADNAEHTIIATDKAGNTTTYKISVYKIYTVTFVVDGETHSIIKVNHDDNAAMPQIPTKTGYTQVAPYWDKDGKNITENTTITAVYTINKYNVTFKAGTTTVETIEVEHGGSIAEGDIPSIPTKTGYTQTAPKWDVTDLSNITSNKTVNAVYTINKYTVTFKNGEDIIKEITVNHGSSITNIPEIPELVGYHGNWDVTDFTNITSDMTVNAVYEINKYTVKFMADGKVVKEFVVEHGSAITEIPEIPAKTGYTDTDPVWSSSDFSNITSDRIVTAVYTANRYTVTFVIEDTTVEEIVVKHGDSITNAPSIPAKEGYHAAWDTSLKNITSDMTTKAVYEINKYTVTFKADGNVVKEFTVEHGGSVTDIPEIPVKEGYTETAPVWDVTDFSNITADVTVNAVYTQDKVVEETEDTDTEDTEGSDNQSTEDNAGASNKGGVPIVPIVVGVVGVAAVGGGVAGLIFFGKRKKRKQEDS